MKLTIFGISNQRTKCYLFNLIKYFPDFEISLILINNFNRSFENVTGFSKKRKEIVKCPITNVMWESNYDIKSVSNLKNLKVLNTSDPNDTKSLFELSRDESDYIIYSGPPGVILHEKTISACSDKLIHSHPGYLPFYRGSTTFFYSAIIDKNISASVFKLNKQIDSGLILKRVTFNISSRIDYLSFEKVSDSAIRWKGLEKLFLEGEDKLKENNDKSKIDTFYIIHPILRTKIYLI